MPGDKFSFRVKSGLTKVESGSRLSAETKRAVKKLLFVFVAFLNLLGKPLFLLLSGILIVLVRIIYKISQLKISPYPVILSKANDLLRMQGILELIQRLFVAYSKLRMKAPKFIIPLPRLHFLPVLPRKKIILVLSLIITITIIANGWLLALKDLPQPGQLITRNQILSTKIYDRNGNLLFKFFKNQNRTLVKLEEVPVFARLATIAIEDSDFYSHPGFSIKGMTRAIFKNITRGELTGGSTITQQVVKNTLLSPKKTFNRKIKELILAIQVEMAFSKDQILEMYLNEVSYGGSSYGIEEASQYYFGKHVQSLTLAESALLAGLPKAPTTYSPFGVNPQMAKNRQKEVLQRMVEDKYISQQEADQDFQENIEFIPHKIGIEAPHFVMYVKQLLAQKYGEDAVEKGGLEVITSLDLSTQKMAEGVVALEMEKIKKLGISNGAALITRAGTGEILAMVGSKDYFDTKNDGNYNVATALRQPGSSIKPVNYSYAIESQRFTAASIISDTPITYHIPGSESYTPHNYDSTYRGNVTLRMALASSLNVPAVKILASYGVRKMIEQAQNLGITTWEDQSRFGLSLTLGGGEVKMIDMNTAYGTFANYGRRVDSNPIVKITDYRGQVIEENTCIPRFEGTFQQSNSITRFLVPPAFAAEANENCGTPAIDPRAAFIITDILKDNRARSPVFGPNSQLVIKDHPEVAVKTGTTQNLRDNWTIGYTKDFVVSTWVGNNNNTPMSYVASGVTGASPIWHNIMTNLLEYLPPYEWEIPEGIVQENICLSTGTLACEGCQSRTEYFIEGTQPKQHCAIKKEEEPLPSGGQIL
ncbi:MAG: hypothetical protein A3D24_02360 [Candidatus Blackburnbacteria bacterium RIFCSPHIGHO2_02_FULL_39_13]|uniref:Uncharacterized protein n=1 Tax=Candidatus Blackburnbacteria bacterium RIFCSPLOWO2_01_FULL_40_20 TaxID=1797519 RepID=A0A1G1VAR1_9BACT|nr:MAG: hypothetical protein A2694_02820 [Candidatus Blackburnbacteria bacterium RIFCSPHIGHO2_01_FULL_40_17]OGY09524.1 MAG: hypothetical protein A3D24_02360 [Candidatus Blackburnbacteria bacterium RIFCSPHIGHO2_02_FULL_39_13]OGY12538.1 MAG: hypothetical protein A3A77_01030 [Candidatus Blackburnbacteria bacterium RIFCSPLOWO2_01_FULL_40_20]OGY14782.1 MAG: hypothetical protein A3I52_02360 [Candidatus Blackburnbacteria bacterium RIFCSPLOWO2_02_FULL_40_10]HBL52051.1 penicillin-binding protein [Candid